MNAMKKLICLLLMLCAGTAAFAWGGREHRLIAYIAEAHLTPRTRQVLDRYLDQSIVEYSTWMDRYRTAPGYEITTYWHMVTIDKDGSVPPEPLRPNGDGDAVRQLTRAIERLRNYRELSDSTVNVNLKYVIHLVGEMHCPGHIYFADLPGGMDAPRHYDFFLLKYKGKEVTYHWVWDGSVSRQYPDWTEEDFRRLCREAKQRGIRVILDGVFNHTGSQSRYFNADGFYPGVGAAQSTDSPYFNWFSFHPWPTDYDAWWGIMTLPAVQENEPDYRDFIIRGQDSVVRHWLRAGASGWRLDVADELPDDFIAEIRTAMEETAPDSFLLGEVWEDATTKVAYSQRRHYLLGHELHGVMNYPFRTALIAYLRGGDADDFRETLETLRENYPPEAFLSLMNFLGTHDTPRILTVLGADSVPDSKADRAAYRLSPAQRQIGLERLRLAALILFTFPGAPTVYYGDEAAMEGWEDPFNRAGYPWAQEDTDLKAHFAELARFRRSFPALQAGVLHWIWTSGPLLIFARELDGQLLTTVVNAADVSQALLLPWSAPPARDLLTGQRFIPTDNAISLTLPPRSGLLLQTDLP